MGRNIACPGAVGLAAHLLAFILNYDEKGLLHLPVVRMGVKP